MLFKEFVLHNFGIYRGRHAINLESEPGRPIVLFGALNGSGKTTFLDGLQLALYGKQARCAGRGNMAYPEFLRSCINRHVGPTEGAGLELEFWHHHEGHWQRIRVQRTWSVRGESVRETLEVYRDEVLDSVLSERWSEYVEDFIPSQISELFFFDGEKIEALAEESSASAIIRTGIHALLGLDVVDRLSADLKVLQRRRRVDEMGIESKAKLDAKQKEHEALTLERTRLAYAIAEQKETVTKAEVKLKTEKEKYLQQGGERAAEVAAIEARLSKLREEKRRQDANLHELSAGAAPLLMVQELILTAKQQAEREQETRRAKEMLAEIKARDSMVLATLKQTKIPESALAVLSAKLIKDRETRANQINQPVYLHVAPERLSAFSETTFKELKSGVKRELAKSRELAGQIDHVERLLAGMPSPEMLAPIVDAVNEAANALQRAHGALELLEQQYDEIDRAIERVDREYQSLMTEQAQHLFKSETTSRVLEHTTKVENTLRRYRDAILARNLERLSALILDSFQHITRKKNMFARIEIAPTDYRLSLIDRTGKIIPSHQLSAGERQLLAVSILWGLSRAAGRPLPAIIDTPLGRLDGKHRSKLVKNYFPNASHQVILLSTDQEIDGVLHPQLSGSIAKEYLIEFNEETSSSEVREGYFDFEEDVAA